MFRSERPLPGQSGLTNAYRHRWSVPEQMPPLKSSPLAPDRRDRSHRSAVRFQRRLLRRPRFRCRRFDDGVSNVIPRGISRARGSGNLAGARGRGARNRPGRCGRGMIPVRAGFACDSAFRRGLQPAGLPGIFEDEHDTCQDKAGDQERWLAFHDHTPAATALMSEGIGVGKKIEQILNAVCHRWPCRTGQNHRKITIS